MSKEYPCVYYDHSKCQKFSDDQYNAWCVNGPCEDQVISNADNIRSMTDEELAKRLIVLQQSAICYVSIQLGYTSPSPEIIYVEDFKSALDWLKQPYKEDST